MINKTVFLPYFGYFYYKVNEENHCLPICWRMTSSFQIMTDDVCFLTTQGNRDKKRCMFQECLNENAILHEKASLQWARILLACKHICTIIKHAKGCWNPCDPIQGLNVNGRLKIHKNAWYLMRSSDQYFNIYGAYK